MREQRPAPSKILKSYEQRWTCRKRISKKSDMHSSTRIELPATAEVQTQLTPRQWSGLIGGPLVFLVLWFAPTHESPAAQHAIAIAAFMIVFWVSEAVDHALAGFIGLFLFWALGVAEFERAFSGFSNETTWFLLGAILIGAMVNKSGL